MDQHQISVAKVTSCFSYEKQTGSLVWLCGPRKGTIAGTRTKHGYVVVGIDRYEVFAHRLIWIFHAKSWPAGFIDHINGVRHDNRIENLRVVSRQENAQNRRNASKTNHSGLLGVSRNFSGKDKPYVARICSDGNRFHLGCFETAELAHAAYVKAKRAFHAGNTL